MKKKKYKYLLFLYIICFSCGKDFLNFPVPGVLTRQDYVKDLQTTQEFLNGIYNKVSPILAGNTLLYPEVISDNIKPVTGGTMFNAHYNWSQRSSDVNSNDANLNLLSVNIYNVISGCNFVIESSLKFEKENQIKAADLRGQALTIRALMYYMLVNIYSQPFNYTTNASHPGVAINTESDWNSIPVKRNTVSEVYNFILDDLKKADELLPPVTGNTFYINSYAVKGLLARVLLSKGDHRSACDYARYVLSVVPIMTANYPGKLYTLQETEALFQIPQNSQVPILFSSYYFRTSVQFHASSDIASILNESTTDLRRSWVTKNVTTNIWTVTKYPQGIIANISVPSISYYHTVIRSSEMCLIAAEAYAKLGGSFEDSSRFYLNEIRKRADIKAKDIVAKGPSLLDSVYKERRKELAFEGFRMFDLLRWNLGINRTDVTNPLYKQLPFPSNMAIAPIPEKDVLLIGLEQNMDY
ncbi:RagB/SusD family nutrient uptake outer membrane protein [Chitinophaga sp. SYP-B3965]|uniref:RagB/SusD family nutrient uptake outer membrane protein n=1 Tax=Chitinophaga sp. SYP-B3965 TaxID=2663120 RepID=UPI001564F165|nr:RagB/SusD family nutrient uptake outer membrane protein [Chitinophaga sp. SYP-B3965]